MSAAAMPNVSAVAIGNRAVMLEGPPGSGKSTLALALIDRGAQLIGDDGIMLEMHDGALWASPPPNTAGKLEIRNVGIIELPATKAPVALILSLTPEAPRFVEEAEIREISGTKVPQLHFDPDLAAAPIRAEWALRLYGLPG